MKGWIMLVVALVLVSGFATVAMGENLRAGETVSTDKPVYVMGETIWLYFTGDPNTTYDVTMNGRYLGSITTNASGEDVESLSTYFSAVRIGENTVQLRDWSTWDVLASTTFEVRDGLTLWPSKYTGTSTYLNGETIWIKLYGENNKEYRLNVTNSTGVKVYPTNSDYFTVTTNDTGVAVFNLTAQWGDDGYKLNLFNGSNYIQSARFSISSIGISAVLDREGSDGVYLLSESLHVYVSIYWLRTQEVLNNVTYRWWIVNADNNSITFGPYASHSSEFTTEPLNFYSTPSGEVIHPNEMYYLKVEYEMTDENGRHYAEKWVPFYTGELKANMYSYGSFYPGNDISFTIAAYAEIGSPYWMSSRVPGATVEYINITIKDHWQTVWTQNYTDLGNTDINGNYYFQWTVPTVERGSVVYVEAKIVKDKDNVTVTRSYTVGSNTYVFVAFENSKIINGRSNSYLSGDTMEIYLGYYAPEGVSVNGYEVTIMSYSYNVLYHTYTQGDTITYTIPTDYSGNIYVYVTAHFSDGTTDTDQDRARVYYGALYLDPSSEYYMGAGDSITIYSKLDTNVMHVSTIEYTVYDEYYNEVMTVEAPLGAYTFTIPGNSDTYYIEAVAKDGKMTAYGEAILVKYQGYFLETKLITESKYQNNIYEPGQTIEIQYNITKYGDFTPEIIMLHWAIEGTNYQWSKVITEDELTGVINITIPEELRGIQVIKVWISWAYEGDPWNNWFIWESGMVPGTISTVSIDVQSGSWAMENLAGMPKASFVNLVLGIVALVIAVVALVLLLFRKGGASGGSTGKGSKKSAPKPYSPDGEEEGAEGGEEELEGL